MTTVSFMRIDLDHLDPEDDQSELSFGLSFHYLHAECLKVYSRIHIAHFTTVNSSRYLFEHSTHEDSWEINKTCGHVISPGDSLREH
jgi:hypothetical protein